MGFRRDGKAARRVRVGWSVFVDSHNALIGETGLPLPVVASEDLFVEFLQHGYLHPSAKACFDTDYPSARQAGKLEELVDRYFGSGREFFMVMALDADAQERLRKKHGPEEAG